MRNTISAIYGHSYPLPGQELCEVFPGNQNIIYGSDIIVSLKASPNSNCHNKNTFNTSRVYWTLNNQRIAKHYYDSNSSFASVSIGNFSLARGVIECLLDGDILGGVIFTSYYVLSNPQNVSCVGKLDSLLIKCIITCNWDLDHTENTNYTVLMKQGSEEKTCISREKSCTFADERGPLLSKSITITVTAENPVGKALSDKVTYDDVWSIVKIDPPDVHVELELTYLRVNWENIEFRKFETDCEIHFTDHERDSYTEPVKPVKVASTSHYLLTGVKPCTNYTISVCCKLKGSIWSACSQNVSVLTYINVSHVQLWRSKSVLSDKEKRSVHLMWKGVPASCNAFDEYRLFDHTYSSNFVTSFKPSENHTFITLDGNSHRLSVAAFHNNTHLTEAFIDIPSTAEDLDFPPLRNVSILAKDGEIHVTWDKPPSPVSGYIIVWNSTDKDFLWQQTQETQFSVQGEPLTLYTISVSPIYEDGPGDEVRIDKYIQEGMPPKVSEVRVTWISDKNAEIQWVPASHTECCALVVNYTVIFKAQDDPKPRNVTVSKKQRSVILDDLRPSTVYAVYVVANSMASSSNSDTKQFSTKLYGGASLTTLIAYCLTLALLPVFVVLSVMMRKKYLSEKFPNPRFSSLTVWSSQCHRTNWNPLTMPWVCDTEKILRCHLDTEAVSISPASRRELKLEASMPENMVLASSPIIMELPSGGKRETSQIFPLMDVHTPGVCPLRLSQSSYRNQTTVMSPVKSPRKGPVKPCPSEETEMLLKQKFQNETADTTYVAVDAFEHGKRESK
ncbi:hypothetical protein P4O66_005748 [Electrophorus voltai]|uniref:Fibronectin type-III domain-containing protein n=1 Tax=Electrophorus voltai TaxID=2609070 RepID=A0AAD8ZK33_9TELE|nr:hypothetical protein P4O66_005748 [Electrophorus voltai]